MSPRPRNRWLRGLVAIAATLILASPVQAIGQSVAQEPPFDRSNAMAERAVYGLSTSDEVMDALEDGADVGTDRWGIPLTVAEESSLDLPGRMAFANAVDERVLTYARTLPEYAGAWVDQLNDGDVVVLLTAQDAAHVREIERLAPPGPREVRTSSATYTYDQLEAAAVRAREEWSAATSIPLVSLGIDERLNQLRLAVAPSDLEEAAKLVDAIAERLGVRVALESEVPGVDVVCSARTECFDPMRAGIRIRHFLRGRDEKCTMGFHILVGASQSRQFLTAGHCGFEGSDDWLHGSYGLVGSERATLYAEGGRDIMRVSLDEGSQISSLIYGVSSSIPMTQAGTPVQGETVCASQAQSDIVDCGTVTDAYKSWISETAGYTVYGATTDGIPNIKGDSGSPLYRVSNVSGGYFVRTPLGIVDHENGHFAKVKPALDTWGATIYQ